jgi:ABC-2 type transport system permease protein
MTTTIRVMGNEAYKALIHLWSYRYNSLAEMLQRSIVFLAIGFFLGMGTIDPQQMAFVLPGWMMTFYARIILFQVNDSIAGEAMTGTLEQMYMSPVSSGLLLLGRAFAILIVATITVFLSAAVLVLLVGIRLQLSWDVLPIVALTLTGLFGFSFLLGGAALVFKNVRAIADLLQDLILFVNGTVVPVALMPAWLQTIGLVFPTTYGITLMRRVALEDVSLSSLLVDGSLLTLLAHSAVYLLGGWLIYALCERAARQQGTLGQY